jgi:uncharacterized protein (TIGR00661 family)
MGHAGRSIALVERLEALGHQVRIFTFADAHRLLARSGYEVQRIEGLQFRIARAGGVDTLGSLCNLCGYLRRRRRSLDMIRQMALAERPELFITDFEPLTALAAESLRTACVSIDNQHRFCHPLGADFPLHLRVYSRLTGAFVRRWIRGPRQCIVAVFHRCPSSRHYQRVDVLLRKRIAQLQPRQGDHAILYARGALGSRIAAVASTLGERFIAYGCRPIAASNIEFKETSDQQFAADLASCRAVICTGGQQLIGEARYFGKPLLIIPMPKQHEQEINARYARQEGIGDYCPIEHLTPERIQRCFDQQGGSGRGANGVDQVLDLLGIGHG